MRAALSALNDALRASIARGERPFCCFGCGEWFAETPPFGPGRPRIVCNDPVCRVLRVRWRRDGRWPNVDPLRVRGWKKDLNRPTLRQIFEFGDMPI